MDISAEALSDGNGSLKSTIPETSLNGLVLNLLLSLLKGTLQSAFLRGTRFFLRNRWSKAVDMLSLTNVVSITGTGCITLVIGVRSASIAV